MFTGIVETIATIKNIMTNGTNKSFWLSSSFTAELKVDQSVSHNGVCLTIEDIIDNQYKVTAIQETLLKTTIGHWAIGDQINLERCMAANGRFDGHFVSGHIDTTASCISKQDMSGSWLYRFEFDASFGHLIIEKGSIAVNGISLTIFDITNSQFSVAIIPYTYMYTAIQYVEVGSTVNIEFDLLGKYIHRKLMLSKDLQLTNFAR